MEETKLMKEQEVAKILGMSVFFLRNHRHKGGGPRYIKIGGAVRYLMPDLIEFIDKSRRASTSPKTEEKEIGK